MITFFGYCGLVGCDKGFMFYFFPSKSIGLCFASCKESVEKCIVSFAIILLFKGGGTNHTKGI